jgi:hypothetical protein
VWLADVEAIMAKKGGKRSATRRHGPGIKDTFLFEPATVEHFEQLTADRGQRAGICKGLIHQAAATPFKKRRWFSVAEIAKAHARDPDTLVLNPQKHAAIVDNLRASIVGGEFVDERNRLQVMNLHPSPHMGFRFHSDAARNSDWFQKLIEFVWIRRDMLLSWCQQYKVPPPTGLCLEEKTPTLAPIGTLALEPLPVTQEAKKAWKASSGSKLTSSEIVVLDAVNALWPDGKLDHKAKARDERIGRWLYDQTQSRLSTRTIQRALNKIHFALSRP